MIYNVENIELVADNFVTINRGDILVGMGHVSKDIVIFRLVTNERDF